MLRIDRADKAAADAADTGTAGVALVPMAPASSHAPANSRMPRPDPTFVTHLIAMAEQVPQTRHLRRAAPREALSAYAARLQPAPRAGGQTRQVI
jgi:hypothetical protein